MSRANKYPKINEVIARYLKDNPGVQAKPLARIILEKESTISYHPEHLSFMIRKYKVDNNLVDTIPIQEDEKGGERYNVVNHSYRWKTKKLGEMNIPVELADELFYEYSRHGLDMSQVAIRNKHDISIQEWHSIKGTLWLYKDSHIFSPYTLDSTPDEEMEAMVDSKMQMKFQDKTRIVEKAYEKETLKAYKKAIRNDSIKTFALERMIDELYDVMPEIKPVRISTNPKANKVNQLVTVIADLHIGSRVESMRVTPDYSSDTVRRYLASAAEDINAMRAQNVTIVLLGDLIESFTGLTHKTTWQEIEYGMYGAQVIRETLEILEEFVGRVNNVERIIGIGGNHDRSTSDWKEDNKSQIAEVILYFVKRLYKDTIDVEYDPLIVSRDIDGIQYLFTHGHKKVIRDGKQAVIDYGNSKLFNLIVSGHIHRRRVNEDERTFRWIVAPAVFSGNYYSESNAWNAPPGFLMIYNQGNGKPRVIDVGL